MPTIEDGSQLVQVIDQLAKSAGVASVKIEHESRKIAQGRFI
jgi:transcriptional regulator